MVGPTGSGKTPLGTICEQKGLWGRKCYHFDFGAALREIAKKGVRPASLTDEDAHIIVRVLKSSALLENEYFHIARKIIMSFAEEKRIEKDDLLILNGLPRHLGQAGEIDEIIDIRMIVYLECKPEIVSQRIRFNSGGDRSERSDDSLEAVEKKLKIFHDRTFPLLSYFRSRQTRIEEITVSVNTTPEEIHHGLECKQIL